MGVRALRLVTAGAALAVAFAVTAGPAIPAEASSGEVVIAVAIESNGNIVIAAVFLTGSSPPAAW